MIVHFILYFGWRIGSSGERGVIICVSLDGLDVAGSFEGELRKRDLECGCGCEDSGAGYSF